jgi:predicted phosphoribosyltransferase
VMRISRGPAPFRDRHEAGIVLAGLLRVYARDANVVVLGLARGGVPVAYEIAQALDAPLDSYEVRKIGTPGHEELAMGALGSRGAYHLNPDIISALGISHQQIENIVARERSELIRREKLYRDSRPRPNLAGKTVILVDDGLATGASMHAAIESLRAERPAHVVVAVPVAPADTIDDLRREVDAMVCATVPEPFIAVGAAYADFAQVTDDEVRTLLEHAFRERQKETDMPAAGPDVRSRTSRRCR